MKTGNITSGVIGAIVIAFVAVLIISSSAAKSMNADCEGWLTDSTLSQSSGNRAVERFYPVYRKLTRAQADEAKTTVCECMTEKFIHQEGKVRMALLGAGLIGQHDIKSYEPNSALNTTTMCMDAAAEKFMRHTQPTN